MFIALQLSIEVVKAVRPVIERLARRNAALADQLGRAVMGVPLSLAEGSKRAGKDQAYHYRVAASSASEARTATEVADAMGFLDGLELANANALIDRQAAIIHRLVNPRPI